MPLRKISDADYAICKSAEHEPPTYIVLDAGTYEWTCPACGHRITWTVYRPSWEGWGRVGQSAPPLRFNPREANASG